jgi:hypothetical protein
MLWTLVRYGSARRRRTVRCRSLVLCLPPWTRNAQANPGPCTPNLLPCVCHKNFVLHQADGPHAHKKKKYRLTRSFRRMHAPPRMPCATRSKRYQRGRTTSAGTHRSRHVWTPSLAPQGSTPGLAGVRFNVYFILSRAL